MTQSGHAVEKKLFHVSVDFPVPDRRSYCIAKRNMVQCNSCWDCAGGHDGFCEIL